jgi:hypothetical protein
MNTSQPASGGGTMNKVELLAELYSLLPLRSRASGISTFSFDNDNDSAELIIDDDEGNTFVLSTTNIQTPDMPD